jgi:clan AA aspartic protease
VGLTYVTVKLRPLAGSKRGLEESFLVDTGAVDCLVAESKLRKLGIKPEGKDVYELADGTTVELPFGFARVSFMGAEAVTKVTFGRDDAESILGVTALESTGIGIDPVTRTLKRMAAKPLKVWSTSPSAAGVRRSRRDKGRTSRRGRSGSNRPGRSQPAST